jgi:predicted flap endonuclease-1-like 5' DNA nuclease
MRRVVGAAIVIVVLGGSNLAAWLSSRHPVIPADSAFGGFASPRPSASSTPTHPAFPPLDRTAPAPLSFGHDPLRFLSTAPADSLERLPGVGPVLARRLLDARRNVGPFRSWDDVDRVRGIGPKTIERLKNTAVRR